MPHPAASRSEHPAAPALRGTLVLLAVALLLVAVVGAPAAAQGLPRRTAHEAFRLGGIDAPQHEAFPSEPRLEVTGEGAVITRSVNATALEVFDAAGRHLGTVGRSGDGPGEFRGVVAHGILGDTLWAVHFPTPRVSRFRVDGTHLADAPLRLLDRGMTMSSPETVTALLRDGWTLTVPSAFVAGRDDRVAIPVLLGRLDSGETRSVAEQQMPPGLFVPGVGVFFRAPFIPLPPLFAVAGDGAGFATASWEDGRPGHLQLARFHPDGTEAWARPLTLPAERIPPAVRSAMVQEAVELATPTVERLRGMGQPVRGSVESLVREGLHLPEYHPPVDRMVVGSDGGIWLRRGGHGDTREWVVLDPEGAPRFSFLLPAGTTIGAVLGDSAWASLVGEYDIPYVVRYDLR